MMFKDEHLPKLDNDKEEKNNFSSNRDNKTLDIKIFEDRLAIREKPFIFILDNVIYRS